MLRFVSCSRRLSEPYDVSLQLSISLELPALTTGPNEKFESVDDLDFQLKENCCWWVRVEGPQTIVAYGPILQTVLTGVQLRHYQLCQCRIPLLWILYLNSHGPCDVKLSLTSSSELAALIFEPRYTLSPSMILIFLRKWTFLSMSPSSMTLKYRWQRMELTHPNNWIHFLQDIQRLS